MTGHWADSYVGRPAEGARPCWNLVRQVWIDRLGFTLPRYDDTDPSGAIAGNEHAFRAVPRGAEEECDAVMMIVPVRRNGGFWPAEAHIGVVVAKGLVLHVEEGATAVVEPLKSLRVSRVMRGPWGTVS